MFTILVQKDKVKEICEVIETQWFVRGIDEKKGQIKIDIQESDYNEQDNLYESLEEANLAGYVLSF